jgi:Protein of unknown function (DUF3300)
MQSQACLPTSPAHRRLVAFATLPLLLSLTAIPLHAQYPQYAQPQAPYTQQPYPAPAQQYGAPQYDQAPPTQNYDPNYAQPGYAPSQTSSAPAQALSPEQLEQLVAPIALYPDALVAQVLAAATYPAQVVGADHWLQAQGYASPDQVAYGADGQAWDPSVKALTAFPQVLAEMDRDLQWTTDLGNAYYNQPQDVLQTIQVMRQRAEGAGTLQSTPQEAVSYNQGYIQLAPANSNVVYVPAYNPWDVYGQPVQPYPGFSLLGSLESLAGSGPVKFGLGIAMSAFSHTPFGWAGWALNWLTQSILFNHSNYTSQSTTVAHWNNYPHGGLPTRNPRGFEASNRDSGGYARPATQFARSQAYGGYNRPSPQQSQSQSFTRPPVRGENDNRAYSAYRSGEAPNRGYQQPGNFVRPAIQNNYAYNRPQPAMTAREQAYGRGGLGGGYQQAYVGRPSMPYAGSQRNDFAQRSYSPAPSYSQNRGSSYGGYSNRAFAESKPEKSGGSHFFGGGHDSEKSFGSYKAPKSSFKAPKAPKEHFHSGGHSGGGGHHGGGHRL